MVVGTLANIYAIKQSLSNTKLNKDIIEAKAVISADLIANELSKQQLNEKSMFNCFYIYF